MKTIAERHHAVDALRVLAILAVIAIHTSTRTIEAVNGSINALPFSFLINQTSRYAVPLFFLISGYVLELTYPNHQSYIIYLKKRFNRIFLPYVMWSACYYVFVYKTHSVNFIDALMGGNASYQLYFIPTLLIFYIIFPFLHAIYSFVSNKFVLFILVVLQIVLLYQDYYMHPLPFFYPLDIALLNYAFFIVGMICSHNQTKLLSFTHTYFLWLSGALIVAATVVTSEARSFYLASNNYLTYYSSWRPAILAYTSIFGLVFYYLFERTTRVSRIAHTLSQLSFFVFFVHVLVLEGFWSLGGQQLFYSLSSSYERAFYLVLFFGVTTGVSYLLAFIVHKIPNISKITG